MALRSLALCAGIGGLDLGVRLARPDHRLVGVVERQAYCAAVLVARMADASMDQAPIWSDLRTFDPAPWVGAVDLVTAGFPCQPVSVAGKRLAQNDPRWLWPEVWRIARGVRCRYLFVENVPGLLSAGFADVLAEGQRTFAFGSREETFDSDMRDGIGRERAPQRRDGVAAGPGRSNWPDSPEPTFRRVDDGVPAGVDGCPRCALGGRHCERHILYLLEPDWAERIHALGNACVPQAVAEAFARLEGRLKR